jgi:RNA polymerase sigma factor
MRSNAALELNNSLNQLWEDYRAGDPVALDHIFQKLMPFCLRVCAKTCGRYIRENDDEASIARLVVVEAMDKYDPDKGTLPVFIGQIIRNRIIDFKRKERKQGIIPFSLLSRDTSRFGQEVEEHFYEEILDDIARRQEIDKLKGLLQAFQITFEELVTLSPRQQKTRQSAQQIAQIIAGNELLSGFLLKKKALPLKELEENWLVNRKVADRYRKFIIATALIYLFDFPYLIDYVLPLKGGQENDN